MGGPNMEETATEGRIVFPLDFLAKAIEVCPEDMGLHVAIANGDYETVKKNLYDRVAHGHGITANMLFSLPFDEIRKRAKRYNDRSNLYHACTEILNSYWVTPKV